MGENNFSSYILCFNMICKMNGSKCVNSNVAVSPSFHLIRKNDDDNDEIYWKKSHEYETAGITEILQYKLKITLVNNFLLFECCLDFCNWFWVFLHCWIRMWHPFLSVRSGFRAEFLKNQIFLQNLVSFCGIINWFLLAHVLNMFLRKN